MTGKVYDRQQLVVDRSPAKQLAVEVGKFPPLSPTALVTAFANALETYGLTALEQVTGLDLKALKVALDNLKAMLGGVDLFGGGTTFDPVAAVTQFFASVPAAVLATLGGADWGALLGKLTGGASTGGADPLTGLANFFKLELGAPITAGRLPLIPLAHIRDVQPELLNDPSFDHEETLIGFPDWDWDDLDGFTRPGCAYTMADGLTHTLHSNAIEVGPDDTLNVAVRAKWTDLVVAGAGAVQLAIASYRADDTLIGGGPAVVASAGGAGSSGWVQLSATDWAVPDDAAYVVLELTLTAAATAGTLRFDDGSVTKTGTMPQSYVNGLTGALQDAAAKVQGVINGIWEGLTQSAAMGDHTLPDLFHLFGNMDPKNMSGVGGGTTIADTFTETWTQLWGGFAQQIGGGKSIADAANAAGDVAGTASTASQLGEWNNAILGIRDNRPFDSGMDPTAVSMFPIPAATAAGGEPPWLNATSGSVPMAFWIAPDDSTRGSIQWLGKGNANITALYVDVYSMNKTTGALTWLHTSPDQFPNLTAGPKLLRYQMATAVRPVVAHGDILVYGWRVQGTGTHQIACRFGLAVGDAAAIPQRPSAVRTAATGLVGDLAAAAVPYGGDVPWVAAGIVQGDVPPPYFAPRTTPFQVAGAGKVYDIPTWATKVDVILLGAGGGGHGGDGIFNTTGEGGYAGQWQTETLVRGVDFPTNATQILLDVGAGGALGPANNSGSNGGNTVRQAIPGGKAALVAAGGLGATHYDNAGFGDKLGDSPGSIVYLDVPYIGGGTATGGNSTNGGDGAPPGGGGGGGGGGIWGVSWPGGPGGRGGAWAVARMN